MEKTEHPCQFPIELIERLVLSLSNEGDCVLDPFLGAGNSIIAAVRHGRKGIGAESYPKYVEIARHRIGQELDGTLRTRPMGKAIYDPKQAGNSLAKSPWKKDFRQPNLWTEQAKDEIAMFENRAGAFFMRPVEKTCKRRKSNGT